MPHALAATPDVQADFRGAAVLTPHPGEYRRLASSLGLDTDAVSPEARPAAAEALARRLGCVVTLKGAATIVSDGLQTVVNDTGNAALATAGSGDVLTGVIAGLAAQFFRAGVPASILLMVVIALFVWKIWPWMGMPTTL